MAESSGGGGVSVGQAILIVVAIVFVWAVLNGRFSLTISGPSTFTRQQLDRDTLATFGPVSPGVNRSFEVTPSAGQSPRFGCQLVQSSQSGDGEWTYGRWKCPK